MLKDLLISLKYVWLILSLIGFFLILIPIIDSEKKLYNQIPTCPSKFENKNCILCGSSTSFYLIGNGEFKLAKQTNQIAYYFYFLLITNTIFSILSILTHKIKLQIGS
jgi:hypothetical protein